MRFLTESHRYSKILLQLAGACVLLMFFSIYFPRGLTATAGAIALILGLLAGNSFNYYKSLHNNWPAFFALALSIMFYIGINYTPVSYAQGSTVAGKYLWLIYTVLLTPVWVGQFSQQNWQRYACYMFIIGCVVVSISDILHFYNLANINGLFVKKGEVMCYGTMPFAAFIAAYFILNEKNCRWLFVVALLILSFENLFVTHERTSYICYFLLGVLLLLQTRSLKKILIGFICLLAIGTIAFNFSTKFHNGFPHLANDFRQYEMGYQYTSAGDRALFIKYSIKIWQQHPILGAGTGSYGLEYKKVHGPQVFCPVPDECQEVPNNSTLPLVWVTHPHNEFLFIGTQLGSIGLILFLGLLISLWRYAYHLPKLQSHVLQALILSVAFSNCTNTLLFYDKTKYCFVLFMGLLALSNLQKTTTKQI